MATSDAHKPCLACGNLIPDVATLCSNCNSHQSKWKNRLSYSASIVAVFTFVLGAFAFIAVNFDDVRKVFFWRDSVEFLTLDAAGSISRASFINTGDGEVFVSDLHIENFAIGGKRSKTSFEFREVINPGEVAQVAVPEREVDDFKKALEMPGKWAVATAKSSEEKRRKIASARHVVVLPDSINDPIVCIYPSYTIEADPGYDLRRGLLGEDMITFEVDAYVLLFSIHEAEWFRKPVPVIGYLSESLSEQCTLRTRE